MNRIYLIPLLVTTFASASPQDVTQKLAAWPNAFADAKALFTSGKYEQAEKCLFACNLQASNTAEGELESASALMRLGLALRDKGSQELSMEAASRALSHLDQAAKYAKKLNDDELNSRIAELEGIISERLLGSTEDAKACYRAALQSNSKAPVAGQIMKILDLADKQQADMQNNNKSRG